MLDMDMLLNLTFSWYIYNLSRVFVLEKKVAAVFKTRLSLKEKV